METSTVTWYAPILSALFNDLASVVAPILAALLVKKLWPVLSAMAAKAGLDLEAREEAKLRYVVEKWVRFAEERVEAKYKGSVEQAASKGAEKLQLAMAGIIDDVPGISRDKAEEMAISVLNQIGLGAASGIKLVATQLENKKDQ